MPYSKSTYNLFLGTFNHIVKLVNGIERIIGIYNVIDEGSKLHGIGLKLVNNRLVEYALNIDSSTKDNLLILQNENSIYKWLDKNSVPFEQKDASTAQLNIFNEYKHLILVLRVPQEDVLEKGLIFIYFRDDISHFGVHHSKQLLDTQHKSIIANLLSGSVASFIEEFRKHNTLFTDFAKRSQVIIQQQHAENQKLKENNSNKGFLASWAHQYLEEFSNSDGVNYVYSDECFEFIISYQDEFLPLQKAIKGAVDFAKVMFSYVNSSEVVIELPYLHMESTKKESSYNSNQSVLDNKLEQLSPRLKRAKEFLDKLEESALLVYNSDVNLTSMNVGKAMERPITAAAISDFLSKNKERVNMLIEQFPDNWLFIKENFKPVINISTKKESRLRNLG